jgi:glycosyltransferase involved in cell wall biosynthesis
MEVAGQEGPASAPPRRPGLLSVVAPLHDEEGNVDALCERVRTALGAVPWELVLVDDGSRDGTPARLAGLAAADPRIKVVALSRSFGHQAALTAGLEHARGDVVAMMDGDLQDPPEVLPELLARWADGADVVYAVREERPGETRFKLVSARWFYRVFGRLAGLPLEVDSGDFRLMDRRALDALLAMPERNRFLRGMTVWVGFTQTAVRYRRAARATGETKFTLGRMLRFSFDAITSFSHAPLQAATLLGFLFSGLAFLAIPLTIVARYSDIYVPGVPSTIVIILLLGGIQLITVGIIGEYVGRIYDEVKRRPLYVVRDRLNVEPPPEARASADEDLSGARR